MGFLHNMNNKNSGNMVGILVVIVLAACSLAGLIGLSIFAFAGLFRVFGVQYDSNMSLILLVGLYFLIGLVCDFIAILLGKMASAAFKKNIAVFVKYVLNCCFSWLALYGADELVSGISVPFYTEWVAVAILFVLELAIEDKGK